MFEYFAKIYFQSINLYEIKKKRLNLMRQNGLHSQAVTLCFLGW